MKTTFISDFAASGEVTSLFFVSEPAQIRKSKKGTDYLCLKFQDRTGTIDGRLWDIPKNLDLSTIGHKSFVKVQGSISEWNDNLQLSVSQIRPLKPEEIDMGDFFARSERDPEDMLAELIELIHNTMASGNLRILLDLIICENREALMKSPAAKTVHHAYIGGLLEHILSLCKTSIVVSARYGLDVDLMIAASVLHDMGKTVELSSDIGIEYTTEGTLIGHIPIGMIMTSSMMNSISGFPQNLKIAVLHMIASHHGLLEYGSPKVPLMREAIAFHSIDSLDASLAICDKALKAGTNEKGFTDWVKEIGGPIWNGS